MIEGGFFSRIRVLVIVLFSKFPTLCCAGKIRSQDEAAAIYGDYVYSNVVRCI